MSRILQDFKHSILLVIRMSNILVQTALFALMWYIFYRYAILIPFFAKGNYLLVFIYFLLLVAYTHLNGGYNVGDYRISETVYSNYISIVFINIIYFLQISLIGRMWQNPLPMIGLTIVQLLYALIWAVLSNKIYFHTFSPRTVLYLYEGDKPSIVLEKMKKRNDKYDVKKIHCLNKNDDIECLITGYESVLLDRVSPLLKENCIKASYSSNIRLYIVPSFDDVLIENSVMINLLDSPLYLMKNRGLSFEQRVLKRIMDITLSIIGLVVTSPILLLTSLCIKLEDQGPVFYKQKRLTYHQKCFEVLKFRSMNVNAESDGKAVLMSKNDQRITKVGSIIRKCRIDELPQLVNVLKGDMSIVGPRPERPEIAEAYYKTLPEFAYRLNGKAGITGYAQVMGKYNTTPKDKLIFDLMYLENYSLLFDLKIMIMTIKTVFSSEATEGID